MNRITLGFLVLLSTLALSGCGGGGDDEIIDPRTDQPIAFIEWNGNPTGDTVKDVEQKEFKFTTAEADVKSCLFDVKTSTLLTSFCQAPGQASTRYLFVKRYIDVKLVRLPDGSCGAALVDVELNSIVDVYVNNGGISVAAEPNPAAAC
jgi:hypothetical protein